MGREDFQLGHACLGDLIYWINERTRIWSRRRRGEPYPWTTDVILRDFKFTNAFRQDDRGTIALANMLKGHSILIPANIYWYRLFNLDTHAVNPGFCTSAEQVDKAIRAKWLAGEKIFTSAHMTTGRAYEDKIDTYYPAVCEGFTKNDLIIDLCYMTRSLEEVFKELIKGWMVGKFVGYEIVCDLRFHVDVDWKDTMTWANVGPGARRGLRRLGYEGTLEDMLSIFDYIRSQVESDKLFELRELEHSLCEFDKYQRVACGQGRPRQRYRHEAK